MSNEVLLIGIKVLFGICLIIIGCLIYFKWGNGETNFITEFSLLVAVIGLFSISQYMLGDIIEKREYIVKNQTDIRFFLKSDNSVRMMDSISSDKEYIYSSGKAYSINEINIIK